MKISERQPRVFKPIAPYQPITLRLAYSAGIEPSEDSAIGTVAERLAGHEEDCLMRHLLVALCALLTLALAVPTLTAAQEATPEAGTTTTEVTRTDTRYFLPAGPDGAHSGLTVAATVEGVCGFSSIVALDRPDAWDCISADNEIFDPCFEPPMLAPDELGQLVCAESPFSTEVTLLNLTEPLVRQKEDADPGADPAQGMSQDASADSIEAWDLPWALELANGDQCSLLRGTLSVMAGQIVHYGCVNGGMVLGVTDRSQPVWTVSYLGEEEIASRLVAVTVAWT